jgi:probable phosphoglycerate mutase
MNTGQKLVRGQSDPPLDAHGQQEVQKLAQQFAGQPLHYIITSPLQRALATAQAIAQATGAKLIVAPTLLPWHTGIHTGKSETEAQPDLMHAMTHPEEPVEGGAPYGAYYKRRLAFTHGLLDMVKRYPQSQIAVVDHSRGIATLPSILSNGEEPIRYGSAGSPPPGSVTKVALGPNGRWAIQDQTPPGPPGGVPNA